MLSKKRALGAFILVIGAAWLFLGITAHVRGLIEEQIDSFGAESEGSGITGISEPYLGALNNYTAFMATSSWGLRSLDGGDPPGDWQKDRVPCESPALTYTALGDSLSTGLLAARGYVERHHGHLQTVNGLGVDLVNLGVNGMTSGELLKAIREDEQYRAALENADVITWNIGGNDFLQARARFKDGTCTDEGCLEGVVAEFKANWGEVIEEILAIPGVTDADLRTMNTYNPFVAEDREDGTFEDFKPHVDALNSYACETAARHGIPCADVYAAFNGTDGTDDPLEQGYLTLDGIHPTDAGHRVIADLLRQLD